MPFSNGNRHLAAARFVVRSYHKTARSASATHPGLIIHRRFEFKQCGFGRYLRQRQQPPPPQNPLDSLRFLHHKPSGFSAVSSLASVPTQTITADNNNNCHNNNNNNNVEQRIGSCAENNNTRRFASRKSTVMRTSTTVIDPSIRSQPFRNHRTKSSGSSKGSNSSSNNNSSSNDWQSSNNKPFQRSPPPAYRRIAVNALSNNHSDSLDYNREQHRQRQRQQQHKIFGNPSSSFGTGTNKQYGYGSYPVIGIQVARSIDLSGVSSGVFATRGVRRKTRERLSVVAQLPPRSSFEAEAEAPRFVAVFRFGSVVCFNVSPREMAELVEEIKKHHSSGSLSPEEERKDRFCVHVQPASLARDENSHSHSHSNENSNKNSNEYDDGDDDDNDDIVTADYCIVPELSMKSVDVISNIIAQSVALDAYNDTVDRLLADFERINHRVTVEGSLDPTDRDRMFRSVAKNNAIFLQLTKVGIKDRDNTAWNLSQYETISELMREEFDIDRRFENIEFKLNLIQQNAKFFLEVLANQKSDSLEWIIIVLIGLECILMCVEMSGMGEPLFGYLGQFVPPFFS